MEEEEERRGLGASATVCGDLIGSRSDAVSYVDGWWRQYLTQCTGQKVGKCSDRNKGLLPCSCLCCGVGFRH